MKQLPSFHVSPIFHKLQCFAGTVLQIMADSTKFLQKNMSEETMPC